MLLATSGGGCIETLVRSEQVPNRAACLGEGNRGADHRDLRCTRGCWQRAECELAADNRRRIGKAVGRKCSVGRAAKTKETTTHHAPAARYDELNAHAADTGIVAV